MLNPDRPVSGHARLRRHRVSIPHHAYLVTACSLGRKPVFQEAAAMAMARCFEQPALLGDATMLAWVLMPDHAHWLLQLGSRDALALVVNRLKSASARAANAELGRRGSLWAPAYHDHCIRDDDSLLEAARYICANPLRAGLVESIAEYPFWNAIWL